MTPFEFALLAIEHFRYAGLLSAIFAAVTICYLFAMWKLAGDMDRTMSLLLHTLYLLWQSNVAYIAVISLSAGLQSLDNAGDVMAGSGIGAWTWAPMMVPGAAVLYVVITVLSLVVTARRARHG